MDSTLEPAVRRRGPDDNLLRRNASHASKSIRNRDAAVPPRRGGESFSHSLCLRLSQRSHPAPHRGRRHAKRPVAAGPGGDRKENSCEPSESKASACEESTNHTASPTRRKSATVIVPLLKRLCELRYNRDRRDAVTAVLVPEYVVNARWRDEHTAIRRRDPQDENPVARALPESLPLVDAVDQDAAHDDHDRGKRRHSDNESKGPQQLPDHQNRHDGENRR